jgi:hypothetical protein
MKNINHILLVWTTEKSSRLFLLPCSSLSEEEREALNSCAGHSFTHNMDESICDNLWCVKSAVSSQGDFIPGDVPTWWHHKYLKFEVDSSAFSANIISVLTFGNKVRV